MRRIPLSPGLTPLAIVLVATLAAACGDGVSPLNTAPGYYRLVSVNGQALPWVSPPSMGFVTQIWRGDLVLRSNGTFRNGFGGNVGYGFVGDGRYRVSGDEIVFTGEDASSSVALPGQRSGDSISLSYPGVNGQRLNLVFRRTPLSTSSVPAERFRLRSINGRTEEPLVEFDTTIGDTRYVAHVAFDSLMFSDGVFVRRHRRESTTGYTNGDATTASEVEWTTWGAYESSPGRVVLFYYAPPSPWIPTRDSLSLAADTLVRQTQLINGIRVDRYAPIR